MLYNTQEEVESSKSPQGGELDESKAETIYFSSLVPSYDSNKIQNSKIKNKSKFDFSSVFMNTLETT